VVADLAALLNYQDLERTPGRLRKLTEPNRARKTRRTGTYEEYVNLESIAFRHRWLVKRNL
jgi:hypothetical protein